MISHNGCLVESDRFQKLIKEKEVDSLLEIGSLYGQNLWHMANCLPVGSKITAIDWPNASDGFEDSKESLENIAKALTAKGYDVKLIFGNSHDESIKSIAEARGPFDLVYIDGDHSYDGALKDWNDYSPMATVMVGIHDISNANFGVHRFWKDLKQVMDRPESLDEYQEMTHTHDADCLEIFKNKPAMLGIGVVYIEEA